MKFHTNVKREVRELLKEQLKEYEAHTRMTKEERKELYAWVASGRSPYDNGDFICGADGIPLDFISALRSNQELQNWFDSLSEEEKQAEIYGQCYRYDTETDDVYFDITALDSLNLKDEELPFQ